MKTHCFRLQPGDDLKVQLAKICEQQNILAGCIVSSVGSLTQLHVRLADSKEFLKRKEKFELISLNGTISINGIHLHMSVSDKNGHVLGGHLMDQNLIYTTCELVVLELPDFIFKRELDTQTTFKELEISKK